MDYMSYINNLDATTRTLTPSKVVTASPYEVHVILFLEQLVQYAGIDRSILNSVMPNAIVDLLRYARGD